MATTPLHKTEDWTISGDTLTFVSPPQDTKRVVAHYSYQDPTAPGASNGHTHIREQKDTWPYPTSTWQLTHTPEIATTPTVGQMLIFAQDQGGNFLWVAYRNLPSVNLSLRCMELNSDGTFLQWACPEIQGMDDVAGEFGTALCAHPTNPRVVYFATYNTSSDRHIRIYRSADWATLTKVADIATPFPPANRVQASCTRIYVEQGSTSVWFVVGAWRADSTTPAAPYDAATDGLWGSSDGLTFTKRGQVQPLVATNPTMIELWVKESAPRRIYTWYHQRGWNGLDPDFFDNGFAVSADDGVTWTKTNFGSEVSPAPYFPTPSSTTMHAFPPLTGDANLRLTIQEAGTSFVRFRSYSSTDGGASWTLVGVVPPASTNGPEQTDGLIFFTNPLIQMRVGSAVQVGAQETQRTVDGGVSFANADPAQFFAGGGEGRRQMSAHWSLPWAAAGFHPVGDIGNWVAISPANNQILITTDEGATSNWASLTIPAGFVAPNLIMHGVAFVSNSTRDTP